jgi:hypothetical protein
VLVSDTIDNPPVADFVQRMRMDPTTSELPIGIMSRRQRFSEMQRVAEDDQVAEAFPRPHEIVAVSVVARRLLDLGAGHRVPWEVRARQASEAMDHFTHLAKHSARYDFYDLMRYQENIQRTLHESAFSQQAAEILGQFGTRDAQLALLTVASQTGGDFALKESAAEAFRNAVKRRGILLNRDEILLQYDRYNLNSQSDAEAQKVLGSLLDTIEDALASY